MFDLKKIAITIVLLNLLIITCFSMGQTVNKNSPTKINQHIGNKEKLETSFLKYTHLIAKHYAKKLLRSADVSVNFHKTYLNLDGSPNAHIFIAKKDSSKEKHKILTMAIAPNRDHFPLLFYYFGKPYDLRMGSMVKISEPYEVVVTDVGTFLHKANSFYQWFSFDIFTEDQIQNQLLEYRDKAPTKKLKNDRYQKSRRKRLKAAWESLDSAISKKQKIENQSREVIIPDVPGYPWYLNCIMTAFTVLIGYWNDHGYDSFIPGGNSTNGFYWAVTEEIIWTYPWGSTSRLSYYAQAAEFGNNAQFTRNNLGKEWDIYTDNIDIYQNPLYVSWQGQPYGGHATVGIGYKEDGNERYMILHDTFGNPAWYNYDHYYDILCDIYHYFLSTTNTHIKDTPDDSQSPFLPKSPVELNPISFHFEPPLDYQKESYHCMEGVDLDNDNIMELVICNFRNLSGPKLQVYYYQNDKFVKDNNFNPSLGIYECIHVAKAVDFDNDGDQDIATNGMRSPLRIFVNENGKLSSTPIVVDKDNSYTDLDCGDFDNDGDIDLAASSEYEGKVFIYKNSNNNFERVHEIGSGYSHQYMKIKFFDLNGDSYPELLASDRGGSVIAFANNRGNFSGSLYFLPTSGHGALTFDLADINKDGFVDIVTVHDGRLAIFKNNSGEISTTPVYLNTQFEFFAKDLWLQDLDSDGFPELIVGNYNRQNAIFKNNCGQFAQTPFWISSDIEPTPRIHIFDIQNDGIKEIVFLKARGGTPEFYEIKEQAPTNNEIDLDLIRTTNFSRINFDEAFMIVWSGDVKYLCTIIGDFTVVETKTTHTGTNGSIIQYDLIIPGSGNIADFISIRANHIVTGSGADHGLVFATSPAYKFLVGATFEKKGDKAKIKWSSGLFPTYSPFFKKDKKEK